MGYFSALWSSISHHEICSPFTSSHWQQSCQLSVPIVASSACISGLIPCDLVLDRTVDVQYSFLCPRSFLFLMRQIFYLSWCLFRSRFKVHWFSFKNLMSWRKMQSAHEHTQQLSHVNQRSTFYHSWWFFYNVICIQWVTIDLCLQILSPMTTTVEC